MKTMNPTPGLHALALALALALSQGAHAQVAGTTMLGVSVTEATQVATGWSANKSILGKSVYNDVGTKVGKVEDLIIAPDRHVSYLIIGVGGFIGIGQREVAIPVTQVHEQDGKITIPGATKEALKAMPAFVYAKADTQRQQVESQADRDISKGQSALVDVQKRATSATGDAKTKLDAKATTLQQDIKTTQERLADMRKSANPGWKTQEEALRAASLHLQQSVATSAN
jgi:sporulation protein YlmC with PRC-barrel domain